MKIFTIFTAIIYSQRSVALAIKRHGHPFLASLILLSLSACSHLKTPEKDNEFPLTDNDNKHFIVVAPDRGYAGNQILRDAVAKSHITDIDIVFTGGESGIKRFTSALNKAKRNHSSIFILPTFLTQSHPEWIQIKEQLSNLSIEKTEEKKPSFNLVISPILGESYFIQEHLSQQLSALSVDRPIVLLGYGADSETSQSNMSSDLISYYGSLAKDLGLTTHSSIVWHKSYEQYDAQIKSLKQLVASNSVQVFPVHLGKKLDGMMRFNAQMKRALGHSFVDVESVNTTLLTDWIVQQEYRFSSVTRENSGVIFLAHGSNFDWNETMREATKSLNNQYDIQYVFSMADRSTIEHAIRAFESQGKKHVTIVRVFGREDSFKHSILTMFGKETSSNNHNHHSGHHSSHTMSEAYRSPRIMTRLNVSTVGGLAAHPLFARAMLDRAKALSSDPKNETIILVAHGTGSDEINNLWENDLVSIANQMKELGGHEFRTIQTATWQEDWPEKRIQQVSKVRQFIEQAKENNGNAIIIPARTTRQGPAKRLIPDLDFQLGEGFAPHPLFTEWVKEKIEEGFAHLK